MLIYTNFSSSSVVSFVLTFSISTNWLFNSAYQWTLSMYSPNSFRVFCILLTGEVADTHAYYANGILPSVYLNPHVLISSGDGSKTNPYVLTMNE